MAFIGRERELADIVRKLKSERSIMSPGRFFERFVSTNLVSQYLPRKFEDVAREYLIRMNQADHIEPPITSLGRFVYHDKATNQNGEFDVVTEGDEGLVCYECKYLSKKIGSTTTNHEKRQVEDMGLGFRGYGFFSKCDFEPDVNRSVDTLVTLDDMYDLCWPPSA